MVLRISTASILYRKEFNSSNKHADETLKNWYDRVKVLAELCDYGSHLEAFILNQFVCGLDTFILEHFRSEQKDLSVNDVFDLTKSFEHNSDLVVVKDEMGVKTEELDISDNEHYNDNAFGDSDEEEQGTTTGVVRPNNQLIEQNGAKRDARQDNIQVPCMAEKTNKKQGLQKSFECYLCHKAFKTAGKLTYHFTCCHSVKKLSTVKGTIKSSVKRKSSVSSTKSSAKRKPTAIQTIIPQEVPNSYECYLCHKSLKTAGRLVYHFKLYHTSGKSLQCYLCGKWMQIGCKMARHLEMHFDEKDYYCNECDARFLKQDSLRRHILSHNDPNAEKFTCPKCLKFFIVKLQYNAHLKEHERPRLRLSEKMDNLLNKRKQELAKDGKYKCDICTTLFDTESELNAHAKVHGEEFLCHECGAKLMNKRNLMIHYRIHTNEKPFQCDECGRSFSTKAKCNLHVKKSHTDDPAARPHKCTFCDKAYVQKYRLTEHMKKHTNEGKRFKCDECSKQFRKEDQLARHKMSHVGITRPWKCNYCEKSFRTNYCREEHERTHTGEKPYSCPICGKRFAQQSSLRGHKKVHLKPPRPKGNSTKRKRKQKTDGRLMVESGMVDETSLG